MSQNEFCNIFNTSFLFLPMDLEQADYDRFQRQLEESGNWKLEDDRDKNRYIYRYITDKMNPDQKEACLYLHYRLSEEICQKTGWGVGKTVYHVCKDDAEEAADRPENGSMSAPETDICFQIQTVHLYTFRTKVNIMAIQVVFAKDDPEYIATGLYYLKKVQRAKLVPIGVEEKQMAKAENLLTAVRNLFEPALREKIRFFPHLNEGTERTNIMSLACEPEGDGGRDWKRDLYFLKNGYRSQGFHYTQQLDHEDENLMTSDEYIWGVTGENLACLILKKTDHILHRFLQRFQEEYLLTYIILLHRKYDLYKILTDFGIGEQNDLQTLKAYQKRLNSYQTDYAYERITEVPQYHYLYKRIEEKMELAELFSDVMEPVSELSSLRMEKAEEDRAEQDGKMERALAALSFLAVFSALIDCSDYLEVVLKDTELLLGIPWTEKILAVIQTGFSIGIIVITVYLLRELIKRQYSRKHRKENKI